MYQTVPRGYDQCILEYHRAGQELGDRQILHRRLRPGISARASCRTRIPC